MKYFQVAIGLAVAVSYLAVGGILLQYFLRRGSLGKALWSAPMTQRWLGILWLFFAASRITVFFDGRQRDGFSYYMRLAMIPIFLAGAVITSFRGQLQVHEGGLVRELLVIPWNEVTGWTWGPGEEDSKAPAHVTPSSDERDHRRLQVWTISSWRRLIVIRASRPLKTGAVYTPEVDALMRQYAGGKQRPESVAAGA